MCGGVATTYGNVLFLVKYRRPKSSWYKQVW